nr:short-chain type dehydrogenase/reductase [Tanacetum cinerariifolium]
QQFAVNDAGIMDPTYPLIMNSSLEEFDRIFAVNTRGAYLCCKEAAKRLKQATEMFFEGKTEEMVNKAIEMIPLGRLGALPVDLRAEVLASLITTFPADLREEE